MKTDATSVKISGFIAVHDDPVLNARFTFTINTSNNKVTYTVTAYWKKRNNRGECPFKKYNDAKDCFDGLPKVARMEMNQK